jgi:hypothetical protein
MIRELTPEQHRLGRESTARYLAMKAKAAQIAAQPVADPAVMHALAEAASEVQTLAATVAAASVFIEPEITVPTISPARIAASRANGALSKGALTATTKAISAQHHTIHGLARHQNGTFKLLSSEDPIAFEALKQSLFDEHLPETTTESILVNSMAESNWLSTRAQRLQDTCMNPDTGEVSDEKKFAVYMRYQTTHTRAFHKSLSDLLKLRNEKRKADLRVEAEERKEADQQAKNERHQAQIANKEAQTRYQATLTAEKIASNVRKLHDYEEHYVAQLAKLGLSNEAKPQKAEAA